MKSLCKVWLDFHYDYGPIGRKENGGLIDTNILQWKISNMQRKLTRCVHIHIYVCTVYL